MYLDRTVMGNHAHLPIRFEPHNVHRSLNGPTASGVDSFDDGSDANGTIRYLLELHERIPARMVANVLMSEEAEYIRNRAIDYL